jgi:hypothetical protein
LAHRELDRYGGGPGGGEGGGIVGPGPGVGGAGVGGGGGVGCGFGNVGPGLGFGGSTATADSTMPTARTTPASNSGQPRTISSFSLCGLTEIVATFRLFASFGHRRLRHVLEHSPGQLVILRMHRDVTDGHHADQLPVPVQYRQPPYLLTRHDGGRMFNVVILETIDDRRRHGLSDEHRLGVTRGGHDPDDQVAIGQYSHQAFVIAYWEDPYVQRFHERGRFFSRRIRRNDFGLRRHNIFDLRHRNSSFITITSGHGRCHVAAGGGASPAFDGAVTAERVVRRMLLAHARASIADLCAGPAEQLSGRREAAHPPDGERTEIGAILT